MAKRKGHLSAFDSGWAGAIMGTTSGPGFGTKPTAPVTPPPPPPPTVTPPPPPPPEDPFSPTERDAYARVSATFTTYGLGSLAPYIL
jgi:hypothetical protein